MLSNCNLLLSGIPNNAGPLPGSTKKLHWYSMPLLIVVTLHAPTCGMHDLLYAHNIFFLSIDLFRSVIFVYGYNTLNILMGIKLPSLPVSILYSHNQIL